MDFTYTDEEHRGETGTLSYDYLINATGPQLNFAATPGLGPDGHSYSVCTAGHAVEAAKALDRVVAKLKTGEKQRLSSASGTAPARARARPLSTPSMSSTNCARPACATSAEIVYLTNEYELGDFGVGGMSFVDKGFVQSSRLWTESLFRERGVKAITQAAVHEVMDGKLRYEQLDGKEHDLDFDFAMLLPPFKGATLAAYDKDGNDITSELFAPSGFLKVDADYSGKPYEEWSAEDWPHTYESPAYPNIFARASRSRRRTRSPGRARALTGTVITPSPPRTGMPSGVMAKTVAETIRDRITRTRMPLPIAPPWRRWAPPASPRPVPAPRGSAAAMTMFPVVPDPVRYPQPVVTSPAPPASSAWPVTGSR